MTRRKKKNILKQWKKDFKRFKKNVKSNLIEIRNWDFMGMLISFLFTIGICWFIIWFSINYWSWYCIWDILLALVVALWCLFAIRSDTACTKRVHYHRVFGGGRYSDREREQNQMGCYGCAIAIPVIATIICDLFIMRGEPNGLKLGVIIPSIIIFILFFTVHVSDETETF